MPMRFITPMIRCDKMGDKYACMAMLPVKQQRISGAIELELQTVPGRSNRKIESVAINGITIEAKTFKLSSGSDITCYINKNAELSCK